MNRRTLFVLSFAAVTSAGFAVGVLRREHPATAESPSTGAAPAPSPSTASGAGPAAVVVAKATSFVEAPPRTATFEELVARYTPLADDQITAAIADVDRELETKSLITRANENRLSDEERELLRALLRRHNALQAVRTQRLLDPGT